MHPTYKEIDGCHKCKWCFRKADYDQGPEYYCSFGARPRPPCGSVLMGEAFTDGDESDFDKLFDDWESWQKDREVSAWGFCNLHVPTEPRQ